MIFKKFFGYSEAQPETQEKAHTIVPSHVPIKPIKNQNNIIMEIHNMYDTNSDKIKAEASSIIDTLQSKDITKGERLAKLGFINTEKAVLSESKIREKNAAEKISKLIEYYKIHYPNNKFITMESVEEINKKYGLVCVTADCYKKDIPDKNLDEIEKFNLKIEDAVWSADILYDEEDEDGFEYDEIETRNFLSKKELEKLKTEFTCRNITQEAFYISCPPSECIIKAGYSIRDNGFILKDKIEIQDPIVLHPVIGGFLIVSKWGLEGNDSSTTNETLN